MHKINTPFLPLPVSNVGFGAYQIGREASEKYASFGKPLPSDIDAESILNGVLDLGITIIDTAPAYGCSETRIGTFLQNRRDEYNLCTKVGELTVNGKCTFDFTDAGMRKSVENSLRTLKTDCVDILLIHAPPDDLSILHETDAIETMLSFKKEGKTRSIGFSGKTIQAQEEALVWSDVMMIEYSVVNQSNESIIKQANEKNNLVLVKKAMNSGHLLGHDAIEFLIKKSPLCDALHCTVIGSTSLERMHKNVESFTRLG